MIPRLAVLALTSFSLAAFAADVPTSELVIENHRFTPERLEVPAGQKVKLQVENRDATPEEFDSDALRIEKVVIGHGKGVVYVGPLKAGEYPFIGEYHEKTAKGVIVAK